MADKAADSFRELLQGLETKSQEAYDKALLTLTSSAIGLSVLFLKDFAPTQGVQDLKIAWACWSLALFCTLSSFAVGQYALRKMLKQLDSGKLASEPPGGCARRLVIVLNIGGGVLLVAGVVFFQWFALANL